MENELVISEADKDVLSVLWEKPEGGSWTQYPYIGLVSDRTPRSKATKMLQDMGRSLPDGAVFACDPSEGGCYIDIDGAETVLLDSWRFFLLEEEEDESNKGGSRRILDVSEAKKEGYREARVVALLHITKKGYIATVSKLSAASSRFSWELEKIVKALSTPSGLAAVAKTHPHVAAPMFPTRLRASCKLVGDVSKRYYVIEAAEVGALSGEAAKVLLADSTGLIEVLKKALTVFEERKAFFLSKAAPQRGDDPPKTAALEAEDEAPF